MNQIHNSESKWARISLAELKLSWVSSLPTLELDRVSIRLIYNNVKSAFIFSCLYFHTVVGKQNIARHQGSCSDRGLFNSKRCSIKDKDSVNSQMSKQSSNVKPSSCFARLFTFLWRWLKVSEFHHLSFSADFRSLWVQHHIQDRPSALVFPWILSVRQHFNWTYKTMFTKEVVWLK